MVSTQPLPDIHSTALRLVPNPAPPADVVPMTPIFDLTPQLPGRSVDSNTTSQERGAEPIPFTFDDLPPGNSSDSPEPIAQLVSDQASPSGGTGMMGGTGQLGGTGYLSGTGYLGGTGQLGGTGMLPRRPTSYLNGLSLSAILQMLHLERKTCIVDVSAHGWLGTLIIVSGELMDAAAGEQRGEDAVCAILNWAEPNVTISDGVETFEATIRRPISQLIMDAARMVDELGRNNPGAGDGEGQNREISLAEQWRWLTDSLTLFGGQDVRILSLADSSSAEAKATGVLTEPSGDLARAVRTWTSLLGPNASEVVLTRAERTIIVSPINAEHTAFVYAESQSAESTERIRRSLRSLKLHR